MIFDHKINVKDCDICASNYPSIIEIHETEGAIVFNKCGCYSVLCFVLSGELSVIDENGQELNYTKIYSSQFTLINPFCTYIASTSQTKVVLFYFNAVLSSCTRTFLKRFLPVLKDAPRNDFPMVLELVPMIQNQIESMCELLKGKEVCPHYYDIKTEELFICLTLYYPLNELYKVFSSLITEDLDFRSFVLSNYMYVHTVEEFAKLANMSRATFNRTFQKTFGMSTSVWLRDKMCEEIIKDIVLTKVAFSELAYKYAFSSPAYFTLFCKKRWGKTPNELRKENLQDVVKV